MTQVHVRQTEYGDIGAVEALMYEYVVDFYHRPRPSDEKMRSLVEMLLNEERGTQFVAVCEDEIVGFATLYFSYSTTRADKITVMNDLYVVETWRGKGVAQLLFNACYDYSTRNSYAYMSWVTARDNIRAQRFYDKMGGQVGEWVNYSK